MMILKIGKSIEENLSDKISTKQKELRKKLMIRLKP